MGIFSFLKYTSPLKYLMELVMTEEFHDSQFGKLALNLYAYNEGVNNCRIIIAAYIIGGRLLAYLAFHFQSKKYS